MTEAAPPTSFRALDPADAEAVLDLWRIAEASPSVTDTVEDVRQIAERAHAACLIAEIDGTIVGTIFATYDGWRGYMYRLAVHPDHRRRGIARALVSRAEQTLQRWGVRRVTALVERDREWATAFWAAAGYAADQRMARFVRNL